MRVVGFLAAAAVLSACAPAAVAAPSYVSAAGCTEQQAFVEGDEAGVAARLPDSYEPVRTSSGAPLVFARAMRCDMVAAGHERFPAVLANYGVVIESPDGLGCLSAAPVAGPVQGEALPICNWYTLAWLADDRRAVDWLKHRTPGFPAFNVRRLSFELADDGTLHVKAGGPSPFAIDAVNDEPSPGEKAVRGGYWTDTPAGPVKLVASSNELVSAGADGVVKAAPGSELAALMGAGERAYAPSYSEFASVGIRRGSYRRQRLWRARRAPRFDGSCTFEGDVTFSPPLTNTAGNARYAYEAAGTCNDEPATLRQSGPVEASCLQAHTTFPGRGEIVVQGGKAVRYTLEFMATATEVDFMLFGRRSGFARGHGTFLTDRTPPDVPAKCGGEGLESAPLDVSIATDGPLVGRVHERRRRP